MQNQVKLKIFTTEITEHTEINFFKEIIFFSVVSVYSVVKEFCKYRWFVAYYIKHGPNRVEKRKYSDS